MEKIIINKRNNCCSPRNLCLCQSRESVLHMTRWRHCDVTSQNFRSMIFQVCWFVIKVAHDVSTPPHPPSSLCGYITLQILKYHLVPTLSITNCCWCTWRQSSELWNISFFRAYIRPSCQPKNDRDTEKAHFTACKEKNIDWVLETNLTGRTHTHTHISLSIIYPLLRLKKLRLHGGLVWMGLCNCRDWVT